MSRTRRLVVTFAFATLTVMSMLAAGALADSTPIGALPSGPVSTVQVQRGELVAVALPDRPAGRVWRIARPFDSKVLQEASEANVGKTVVLVFKSSSSGKTTLKFALTRGERGTAYESRTVVVTVT